jgi:class 3 adenylate cyclase
MGVDSAVSYAGTTAFVRGSRADASIAMQPVEHGACPEVSRDGMVPEPPSGVVTLLFTDVEGSAALCERDESGMDVALRCHDDVVRASMTRHRGTCFDGG